MYAKDARMGTLEKSFLDVSHSHSAVVVAAAAAAASFAAVAYYFGDACADSVDAGVATHSHCTGQHIGCSCTAAAAVAAAFHSHFHSAAAAVGP